MFLSAGLLWGTPGRTELGNEIFLQDVLSKIRHQRLGLVVNPTSVLPDGTSLVQALRKHRVNIAALFSPEHGFSGQAEAGAEVRDSSWQKIPVISLYGKTRRPSPEHVRAVDAFVYDIQDVGTRFYTYITTLKYILESAGAHGKTVYVLDRPNPAGGTTIEGPSLVPELMSFIGAFPIPIRYGLTPGELALMMKGEGWVPSDVDLRVVKMRGWRRSFFWADTGLRWISPSPNMPNPETALLYPGTGLLGALTLNPGLGTEKPFRQLGAPWLDPKRVIEKLKGGKSFGLRLEPTIFTPQSLPGKTLHPTFEDRLCRGINIHIIQKDRLRSVWFALSLIKALRETHPEKIAIHSQALNRMFGSPLLEEFIRGRLSFENLLSQVQQDEEEFRKKRQPYLLYD